MNKRKSKNKEEHEEEKKLARSTDDGIPNLSDDGEEQAIRHRYY